MIIICVPLFGVVALVDDIMDMVIGVILKVEYLLNDEILKTGGFELYLLKDKKKGDDTNSASMCGYRVETVNSCALCGQRYDNGDCGNKPAKKYFDVGTDKMPSALRLTYSYGSGVENNEVIDIGPYCRFCVPSRRK